jgi:hypothetical protein
MKSPLINYNIGDYCGRNSGPQYYLAKPFIKNRKRHNDRQEYPDHVFYSLHAILKPLLGNVNCEVIL